MQPAMARTVAQDVAAEQGIEQELENFHDGPLDHPILDVDQRDGPRAAGRVGAVLGDLTSFSSPTR